MTGLQLRIDAFVKLHGSYRAAAAALKVDQAYLYRLLTGEKNSPGPALLKRLGLRRIVTVTYELLKD